MLPRKASRKCSRECSRECTGGVHESAHYCLKLACFSQHQSITQKGVHAHPLTAWEREHWFPQHLSHFPTANFGRQKREHPFVRYLGALPPLKLACCVLIPHKGSHSSAHVSAHAGAHASVHEVVWSYVIWSVFTCSVPYPNQEATTDHF